MKTKNLLVSLFLVTLFTGAVGLGLILIGSGIPVVLILAFVAVYASLISSFVVFSRNGNKDLAKVPIGVKTNIGDELKIIASDAERSVNVVSDIQKEVRELKDFINQPRFVASRNSNKFHRPECRFAMNINKTNAVWFKNQNEAIRHGFGPCHLI